MLILTDTGILLRLLQRTDPLHADIRQAVRVIRQRGDRCVTSPQNAAEFWNVCTRPATARGGLGLSVTDAERRLRMIERLFPVLPDHSAAYAHWRTLIAAHAVMGVQVHDARLVAFMMAHSLTHLLTLNAADFTRYSAIVPVTPGDILASPP